MGRGFKIMQKVFITFYLFKKMKVIVKISSKNQTREQSILQLGAHGLYSILIPLKKLILNWNVNVMECLQYKAPE